MFKFPSNENPSQNQIKQKPTFGQQKKRDEQNKIKINKQKNNNFCVAILLKKF